MIRLTDLTPEQISDQLGLKPFQGRQIFQWLHRKQVFDFDEMTNLSKDLRKTLTETCVAAQLVPVEGATSATSQGTRKALFRMHDGETVESVLIGDRERTTLCLSTQAGCAVKCSFCATGQSGFARNLTAGEIAEQALHLVAGADLGDRTPNIVYMGMGEPFRNYDATVASIRLLMRKDGLNIGARKITVSTVGEIKGIQRFAEENWQVRLSISLHAANDGLRSELVPLNRKFPLKKLMDTVREYITMSGRQVTFEWTLLDGVNDRPQDAAELSNLIRDLKASVNVIPYNPVAGAEYQPPPREKCEAFRDALEARGINANLRRERGGDIDAACGQLRRRVAESAGM